MPNSLCKPNKSKLNSKDNNRIKHIDGIRGWASLVVVLFHLTWEVFGAYSPIYRSEIFYFILDGPLAVYIFFILSGDALSQQFLNTHDRFLLSKLIIKRYFRLTGPILITCFIVFLLMKYQLIFNKNAAKIIHREDWLGAFLPFKENLIDFLKYSLLKVYSNHNHSNSYNPFLWTMPIELYSSFALFLIFTIWDHLSKQKTLLIIGIIILTLLGSFFSLFLIGFLFAQLRNEKFFEKSYLTKISFTLLIMSILLDSYFRYIGYRSNQSLILISTIIILSIYSNKKYIHIFSSKISKFLGSISFALYLIHFAIIISFTSYFIEALSRFNLLNLKNTIFLIISSAAFSLICAWLLSKAEKIYLKYLDLIISKFIKNNNI